MCPTKVKLKGISNMLNLCEMDISPAKKGDVALDSASAKGLLESLSGYWSLIDGITKIHAEYKFKNFKKALDFVNELGAIADAAMHHPDIKLGWGYVHLDIQTHSIGGLHQADFVLAAKADKIFSGLTK